MSDIADRYRRLSCDFPDEVAKVSPERWGAPSPHERWTALGRALLGRHA